MGAFHPSGGIAENSDWYDDEWLIGGQLQIVGAVRSDPVHAKARDLDSDRLARGCIGRGATSEAPSCGTVVKGRADATQLEPDQLESYGMWCFVYMLFAAVGVHTRGRGTISSCRIAEVSSRRRRRRAPAAEGSDGSRPQRHVRSAARPRQLLRGRSKRCHGARSLLWLSFPLLIGVLAMSRGGHSDPRSHSEDITTGHRGDAESAARPGTARQVSAGGEVPQDLEAMNHGNFCCHLPRRSLPLPLPRAHPPRAHVRIGGMQELATSKPTSLAARFGAGQGTTGLGPGLFAWPVKEAPRGGIG